MASAAASAGPQSLAAARPTLVEHAPAVMRDGVELDTTIHRPADVDHTVPAVLIRTPYTIDPSEVDRLRLHAYTDLGVAVVHQMVRGRGASGGTFDFFFQESADGHDAVEWVAAQPWCDGRVAMDGGSYLGTAQYLAAREQPPHLRCIMPAVPAGDFFDELPRIGGAFSLGFFLEWLASLSDPPAEGPAAEDTADDEDDEGDLAALLERPLIDIFRRHGVSGPLVDEVVASQTLSGRWLDICLQDADYDKIVGLPVLTTTGWADGDQPGSLYHWDGIQRRAPRDAPIHLVIGPWMHGQAYLGGETTLHEMTFGANSQLDLTEERVRFLRRHLLGETEVPEVPRVRVYVTGSDEWQSHDAYPPRTAVVTPAWLHSSGGAQTAAGDGRLEATAPTDEPTDDFTFDPSDPFPYAMYGVDVTEAETRPDVLVYSTPPLVEPLQVIGNIWLVLHAATDGLDTDWAARLVDVRPDGSAINLSHGRGYLRARYREGLDRMVATVPDQPATYRIRLQDIGHTFLPGHRLRLEVTSSMFPLADPNPNTGTDPAFEANVRVARQSIFHDAARPSRLLLPITRGRLP